MKENSAPDLKREILFQSSDYKLEKREGRKEGRMGGERERERRKKGGREGGRKDGEEGRGKKATILYVAKISTYSKFTF